MKTPDEISILSFKSPKAWASWLDKNHAKSSGLWLKIAKKDSGLKSVSYPEALETALCYGWIDGQKKSCDEFTWLQKFTPRGVKSIWSKINREKALALIKTRGMKPAGLKAVENAKQNGQWDAAYDAQSTSTVPEDFQSELKKNKKAKVFFETLNSANRYAILFRIHTARKAETRTRRIEEFVGMLARSEKIHP